MNPCTMPCTWRFFPVFGRVRRNQFVFIWGAGSALQRRGQLLSLSLLQVHCTSSLRTLSLPNPELALFVFPLYPIPARAPHSISEQEEQVEREAYCSITVSIPVCFLTRTCKMHVGGVKRGEALSREVCYVSALRGPFVLCPAVVWRQAG